MNTWYVIGVGYLAIAGMLGALLWGATAISRTKRLQLVAGPLIGACAAFIAPEIFAVMTDDLRSLERPLRLFGFLGLFMVGATGLFASYSKPNDTNSPK